MKRLKQIAWLSLFGTLILAFQNCSQVNFSPEVLGSPSNTSTEIPDTQLPCTAGGTDGSATCQEKTLFFVGGVAQVFGNSLNAEDGSGDIILKHPFNGKNARVKVIKTADGSLEVHPANGFLPWACVDHTDKIDAQKEHKNKDGSAGRMDGNCYSPIRWYSADGQQGFVKDINNIALPIQKNSKGEVYRRATPDAAGTYVTNMVLTPPDQLNEDGSKKNLVWVTNPEPRADFMMYFTTLYDGVFPFPKNSSHLKIYDYKELPTNGSAWNELLIENTEQQLAEAEKEGYLP